MDMYNLIGCLTSYMPPWWSSKWVKDRKINTCCSVDSVHHLRGRAGLYGVYSACYFSVLGPGIPA